MKRYEGIHFYINIKNFNSIIRDEEERYNSVNRSIHALDTFFSSIESFGKRKYNGTFVVEKITGSRLHLYVIDDVKAAFEIVKAVTKYAYMLSGMINKEIGKYKNLLDFSIQVGAAFGEFYDFEFISDDFSETTTIGYAANLAAKIQGITGAGRIGISKDIFDELKEEDRIIFSRIEDKSIKKYDQDCYYTAFFSQLTSSYEVTQIDIDKVKEYANSINLYDINYEEVRSTLNFEKLRVKDCKKMEGIPVYADIRNFTSKFDSQDKNINEMARKTQEALCLMYKVTINHGGIHVQFQGDRELALYHDIQDKDGSKCFKEAILASMRMIDAVKPINLNIGVGLDYGRIFATRIGARGEKDNILLGETMIHADYMEDKCAGIDQIAITKRVFTGLEVEDPFLASKFKKIKNNVYIATCGYKEYLDSRETKKLQEDNKKNNYNNAWRG